MRLEAAVVRSLMKRASNAEGQVIERVAMALGYLWRCYQCKAANADGDSFCEKCRANRHVGPNPP